jgi:adenylate cyclase
MSVVGVIEPSLRQAEIERVKRKRPDNLDAYDLVLRAMPHVFLAMPAEAVIALPFLERALALDPSYALAHGLAAFAHEIIFVRGGQRQENRAAALRHTQAAIASNSSPITRSAACAPRSPLAPVSPCPCPRGCGPPVCPTRV